MSILQCTLHCHCYCYC